MKTLLLLAISAFVYCNAQAQAYHGTKSYPIYKEGASFIKSLDEDGKEIVRIEYDLIFSSKTTTRSFSDDWEYTIVAFADDGVSDLDLKLYEYDDLLEEWELIEQDESTDAIPLIVFTPDYTGEYKIEISVYDFEEGYSSARYGLVIYHD